MRLSIPLMGSLAVHRHKALRSKITTVLGLAVQPGNPKVAACLVALTRCLGRSSEAVRSLGMLVDCLATAQVRQAASLRVHLRKATVVACLEVPPLKPTHCSEVSPSP